MPASTERPWLAKKHAELSAREGVTLIYALVDQDGARLLMQGHVPGYVKSQMRNALEWSLEDCGKKASGW